ncbi:MAG: cytidylate kinase [candidate division Zixibacteria bacterium CG_4_9_14_3_um_filter_46_8]|nr:MAG: cytidylate kinase [candidate division Zixibacteria bacterium CG_4_9_14_3_um_filter_46_8]
MIITVDGPAGSGKSTTAKAVAQILGFKYLDTGAMYRAVTLKFIRERVDLANTSMVESILAQTEINLQYAGNSLRVLLNGEEVTESIRSMEVNKMVSQVSEIPEVRRFLVPLQREFATGEDLIAEGRDIGTVVFPNAELKIFMIATENERANRRHRELAEKGDKSQLNDIRESIIKRDQIDSNRRHSPLLKADDAIVIDTTKLDFKTQVEMIVSLFKKRIAVKKLV